ncbi:hypothetical protein [Pisciglobus halotolerans]|uniref:Uncharacterized protein n=1 Tax=Pisciglobus halotolerans TaxID=745365 RepID=A0A1I3E6C6_9LACT|nr:hypothetical protein [Pisciglobus halotolerans]SFH94506.1 hypothetical protein SAMN04489868_1741 [Pisciglobus halotolerans]
MHLDFTDEEARDVEEFVNDLTLTKEEYFLSLHKKNALTKETLKDSYNFRLFIEDYHHMLDNLYHYNFAVKDMIETNNDTKVIDSILHFLDTTIKDPMVLSQIYAIYKKQNEKDSSIL